MASRSHRPGATREQTERRERFTRARRDALRRRSRGAVCDLRLAHGDGGTAQSGAAPAATACNRKRRTPSRRGRHRSAHRAGDRAALRDCREAHARRRASGSLSRSRSAALAAPSRISPHKASCWCSTRSPTRTMLALFFAPPRPLRRRPSSPRSGTAPDATGALAKAASGALEYVPLISVQNLARGLSALKQSGFLVVGLDGDGDADLADTCRCARRWRWSSAPRARACASSPRKPATTSRASPCRANQEPERLQCRRGRALCRRPELRAQRLKRQTAGPQTRRSLPLAHYFSAHDLPRRRHMVFGSCRLKLFAVGCAFASGSLPFAEQADAHAVRPENSDFGFGIG